MAGSDFFEDLEIYRSKDQLLSLYEKYADQYDDVMAQSGYSVVQEYIAKLLRYHIKGDRPLILDVGCGTGSSGVHLRKAGFDYIDGTDPSINSLKVCGNKNIYSNIFEGIITSNDKLSCKDDTYDGVACIGCISKGHMLITPAIEEFNRITKPGGFVGFTINDGNIDPKDIMQTLGQALSDKKIEMILMEKKTYFNDNTCYCCLVKVL